jgi:hypothetical protein
MKRVNKKDWERFQRLFIKATENFADHPERQSMNVFRGDWRAIQWAHWWINETLRETGKG